MSSVSLRVSTGLCIYYVSEFEINDKTKIDKKDAIQICNILRKGSSAII